MNSHAGKLAVIFDMDGVLIDTVEMGLSVRKQMLFEHGVDLASIPDPQGEGHRAASLKNLLATVEQHSGIAIDHDAFADRAREHMRERLQSRGASADPGLVAFLDDLKKHGVICAVASSSVQESINLKLDVLGIKDYFSVVVTGSDVQEHKPHPATYLYALKELGTDPNDCVVFEDSLTGMQSGLAAGCRVIGFTQYNKPHEMPAAVTATVSNWSDISYDKLVQLLAD